MSRRKLLPTVVQGLGSRPFNRDLPETPLCHVHTVVMLTGHPKIADLHRVVLCNQTVSGCQIPLRKKQSSRRMKLREKPDGKGEENVKYKWKQPKKSPPKQASIGAVRRQWCGYGSVRRGDTTLQTEQLPATSSDLLPAGKLQHVMSWVF